MNYPLFSLAAITILQVTVPGQCGSYENHVSIDTGPDTVLVPYMAIQPVLILDFPEPYVWHDDEFEPSQMQIDNCNECRSDFDYEAYKLQYFKEMVYDPAMKNSKLPAENRKFLEALYQFMLADDTLSHSIDYSPPPYKVFRPVFKLEDNVVRVTSYYFSYSTDSFISSLELTPEEQAVQYYLFRSNSTSIRPCKLRDETLYRTECSLWRSNKLYTAPIGDSLLPAFCSPFKIVLEHRKDTAFNRMLAENHFCEDNCRWLCGACNQQQGFAQLKGVPLLWFTTDIDQESGGYPTRAIYIDINNTYALELWRYELDMSGCSCI